MSYSYASRGGSVSWERSCIGERPVCLALCELLDQPEEFTHHDGGEPGIMVVPREDMIVTRYFCVFTGSSGWSHTDQFRASELDL